MANRGASSGTRELIDLRARIEKLEQAVFAGSKKGAARQREESFKGATGGLRLLVQKGFFDRKRTFGEIKRALADHNYHYSKQAVQTPLNTLSKLGGLLVSFREEGRKVYAKRK